MPSAKPLGHRTKGSDTGPTAGQMLLDTRRGGQFESMTFGTDGPNGLPPSGYMRPPLFTRMSMDTGASGGENVTDLHNALLEEHRKYNECLNRLHQTERENQHQARLRMEVESALAATKREHQRQMDKAVSEIQQLKEQVLELQHANERHVDTISNLERELMSVLMRKHKIAQQAQHDLLEKQRHDKLIAAELSSQQQLINNHTRKSKQNSNPHHQLVGAHNGPQNALHELRDFFDL